MTSDGICEYCGQERATLQHLGGNLEVVAHPCCWQVSDYAYGGDTPREEAARCPHQVTELDPLDIWPDTPPIRDPPPGGAHVDIEGEPCPGDLETESEETLYCSACGAIVSRATGELLGHGTPME